MEQLTGDPTQLQTEGIASTANILEEIANQNFSDTDVSVLLFKYAKSPFEKECLRNPRKQNKTKQQQQQNQNNTKQNQKKKKKQETKQNKKQTNKKQTKKQKQKNKQKNKKNKKKKNKQQKRCASGYGLRTSIRMFCFVIGLFLRFGHCLIVRVVRRLLFQTPCYNNNVVTSTSVWK